MEWLISGQQSSTFISPASSVDGTLFAVIVRNAVGSVTSSPAILSVSTAPGQLTLNPANGLNFCNGKPWYDEFHDRDAHQHER